jgi:hypothetical protein
VFPCPLLRPRDTLSHPQVRTNELPSRRQHSPPSARLVPENTTTVVPPLSYPCSPSTLLIPSLPQRHVQKPSPGSYPSRPATILLLPHALQARPLQLPSTHPSAFCKYSTGCCIHYTKGTPYTPLSCPGPPDTKTFRSGHHLPYNPFILLHLDILHGSPSLQLVASWYLSHSFDSRTLVTSWKKTR